MIIDMPHNQEIVKVIRYRKTLVAFCGPHCSGKTTLANILAKEINTTGVAADVHSISAKPAIDELNRLLTERKVISPFTKQEGKHEKDTWYVLLSFLQHKMISCYVNTAYTNRILSSWSLVSIFDRCFDWIAYLIWSLLISEIPESTKQKIHEHMDTIIRALLMTDAIGNVLLSSDRTTGLVIIFTQGHPELITQRAYLSGDYTNPDTYSVLCTIFDRLEHHITQSVVNGSSRNIKVVQKIDAIKTQDSKDDIQWMTDLIIGHASPNG